MLPDQVHLLLESEWGQRSFLKGLPAACFSWGLHHQVVGNARDNDATAFVCGSCTASQV